MLGIVAPVAEFQIELRVAIESWVTAIMSSSSQPTQLLPLSGGVEPLPSVKPGAPEPLAACENGTNQPFWVAAYCIIICMICRSLEAHLTIIACWRALFSAGSR